MEKFTFVYVNELPEVGHHGMSFLHHLPPFFWHFFVTFSLS